MGLFKRSKKRDTENIAADDVLLKALINNETITREKAMTVPAVCGAVDFISGSIACMPVRLFKYVDGTVVEQKGDRRCNL